MCPLASSAWHESVTHAGYLMKKKGYYFKQKLNLQNIFVVHFIFNTKTIDNICFNVSKLPLLHLIQSRGYKIFEMNMKYVSAWYLILRQFSMLVVLEVKWSDIVLETVRRRLWNNSLAMMNNSFNSLQTQVLLVAPPQKINRDKV